MSSTKANDLFRRFLKVVQAGLAENATPEDRETMALLLSDDLEVSGGMMDFYYAGNRGRISARSAGFIS